MQRNDAIIIRASQERTVQTSRRQTFDVKGIVFTSTGDVKKASLCIRSMLRTPVTGYKVVTNLVLLHMKNMDTRLNAEYALGLKPSGIFCVQTHVHIFHM